MKKWNDSAKKKPEIGDRLIVKTFLGQKFYAIYVDDDEFVVHRPELPEAKGYRKAWYAYSSRTVVKWKFLDKKVRKNNHG